MPADPASALALWGSADLPGFGHQLLARVFEAQLGHRLPGWRIGHLAPLGWNRPLGTDGGLVVEPLGDYHDVRTARIAAEYQLSVFVPAFPLGAELHTYYGPGDARRFYTEGLTAHPLLASAVRLAEPVPPKLAALLAEEQHVSTRDTRSAESLAEHGVRADVVPHPGLLAGSLVDAAALTQRQKVLRKLDALPEEGAYLVLQASSEAIADLDRLATAVGHAAKHVGADHIVLLPDRAPSDEPPWCQSVPADLVFEDRLAVLAGATAVIATDEHAAAACAGLGCSWVLWDPAGAHRGPVELFAAPQRIVDGMAPLANVFADELAREDLAAARGALCAEFDAVAELAESVFAERGGNPVRRNAELAAENAALRAAHHRLRRRMHAERQLLMEQLVEAGGGGSRELRAELDHERELHAALADRHNTTVAERDACRRELEALRSTKLYRWSTPLRALYGKFGRR
ncbi:MAG: hypothetical protein GEU98_23860 [Pseudonocardiaceae bacterium]|nr:hypothetical protein [Pseudonocardiaceae bacterium]